MPTYTIFAGVNGAGKTSIYRSIYFEKRYHDSLQNLKSIVDICDELNIYDNTNKFEQIAYIVNGELKWKSVVLPNWTKDLF
ncbi:hypothetical protein [Clostridium thailandense]|uniref:hypothetical protein n=1 Tax=Clostridium thailandense TaxID=2794346 RepID=UPI003989F75F